MSLKQKTITGLIWSFVDSFVNLGVQFVVGIILARILSPREFGLIGMLTIFIAISQTFIDSGFSNALIRKKECTQTDYSTIFFFNLSVGIFFFLLLFGLSSTISSFFREPQLKLLVQVLGFGLILNSLGIIQSTILSKTINFKLQTKVSLIASLGSGLISIILAIKGFGVWSLIALTLSRYALNSIFLWVWGKWKPTFDISQKSFTELFVFGSKLLVGGLIDTAYRNIYYLIIGKYFSAQELGFYTRADQFNALPSSTLTGVIQRVSYPVLASIKEDKILMLDTYKKTIRATMFICFILMLGMAAIAEPMVITLIGEKWRSCIIYLQLLCFVGMFYPLHALNLNMLMVLGRSDLLLRLEIIKKALAVPIIVIGIIWGIKAMIIGMILLTLISYYLNSYWSGRLIGYSIIEQIKDILPSFILALVISSFVFAEQMLIILPSLPLLIIQLLSGAILTFSICEVIHFKDYHYIKEIVLEKILMQKK
jgi:O-antigen/teichoic acid export membrane protein